MDAGRVCSRDGTLAGRAVNCFGYVVILSRPILIPLYRWFDRIPNRIIRTDKYIIQSMIYARNTSAAYIVSEAKTDILLKRVEMLDDRGYNLFHELKYTIGKVIMHK